jgi:hypothetical protein
MLPLAFGIGEPEIDEFHAVLLDHIQNFCNVVVTTSGLFRHALSPFDQISNSTCRPHDPA